MLVLIAVAGSVLANAGAASADETGAVRTRAEGVMAQIDRLDARRADARAAERDARERLRDARYRLTLTQVRISIATRDLATAERSLADLIVNLYKNGSPDPTSYLLAAGSFGDLLDRVDVISRMTVSVGDLTDIIAGQREELEQGRREQARAVGDAASALSQASAARREVERLLDDRRATLDGLSRRIAGLLEDEQQRRRKLAAENTGDGASGDAGAVFYGEATWYGDAFAGNTTASGEVFDPEALTCASPWLPFDTMVRVTLLSSGRAVVVRVNDRGPFGGGIIDLSQRAAREVGLLSIGRGRVQVQVLTG